MLLLKFSSLMSLGFYELVEQGIVTFSMGSMEILGTDVAQTK
jgi:hypothetical protein